MNNMIEELKQLENNHKTYSKIENKTRGLYRELIIKQENKVIDLYIENLEKNNLTTEAKNIRNLMNGIKRGEILKKLYNLYYPTERSVYL